MESLPIVFVALAGLAALAFDDAPAYQPPPQPEMRAVVGRIKSIPVEKSLSPNETLLVSDTLEYPREAPKEATPREKPWSSGRKAPTSKPPARDVTVKAAEVPRARIDVERRRLGPDERLQQAVMSAITRTPNLSGQIAVEARDAVVRLSGWTTTPGQSLRAEKAAARVEGVRQVLNEIRPRMGAITS